MSVRRVLVVDDQTVVREGLVLLLELLPGIEVVGSAKDGAEALALVGEHRPDVVLMDLRMPRVDGVEATRQIKAAHPDVEIVVLTTYADDQSVFAALRAGARGFLTKDADADEIARAIEAVHGGAAQLAPAVQRRLVEAVTTGEPRRTRDDYPDGLTAREVEVLIRIAEGLSNAEIATALYITEATVKTHINNLFAKAALRTRAQAVTYAYHHGLTTPTP